MSDFIGLGLFVIAWVIHSWIIEHSRWRRKTLSHYMELERRAWIENMGTRDWRMIDTSIMIGLQNGTGFFASTSLLAIGAAFTLLNSTERLVALSQDLAFVTTTSSTLFEIKAIGLMLIYAYAFLKFGWAYRLFNYTSILMGAVPMKDERETNPDYQKTVQKAADMSIEAAREFNRGQRAFFLAIGYLGWFLGDFVFIASSLTIYAMLLWRQFSSPARSVLARGRASAGQNADGSADRSAGGASPD